MSIQLVPRLVNAEMDVLYMDVWGTKSYVRTEVELWKVVGLAIHKVENWYMVSHYSSGRAILKRIETRNEAIQWMMKLRTVLSDWTQSFEYFEVLSMRTPIVEQVISLQDRINGKVEN